MIPIFYYYLLIPFIFIIFILFIITPTKKIYGTHLLFIVLFGIIGRVLITRQENNYSLFEPKINPLSIGYVEEIIKTGNKSWSYRTRIKTIEETNFFKKFFSNKAISLYVYSKKIPTLKVADQVSIKNLSIKKPDYGDFKKYLLKEGVSGTAFVYKIETELVSRPHFSLWRCLNEKKQSLINSLQKKMSKPVTALFCSLFLGEQNQDKNFIEQEKLGFKVWGIVHHLARSGLHLAIFILCWFFLLSFLPIPFFIKHIVLIVLSTTYFLLSTPSISFVRAFHLFLLFTLSALLKLPMGALHGLVLSALITLLYNPYQLFFLDFQLSFYLTFCLAWLARLDKQKKYSYENY